MCIWIFADEKIIFDKIMEFRIKTILRLAFNVG